MDANITAIIGAGLLVFLLLFIGVNLDKKHAILKIGLMIFAMLMMILIPKAVMDADTICTNEVVNQTQVGNQTTYDHALVCNSRGRNTGTTMFTALMLVITLVLFYLVIYLIKVSLESAGKIVKK